MSQPEHDRRIDYVEFPVADVALARRFYSSVFGWVFTDYAPAYTSFADGRLSGGFPGGRRFHFGDPCGHELAVWSDPVTQA
jgi:hypothetical protein